MSGIEFPPVEFADDHGLLAVGADYSPETLLTAYRSGIFPWPHEGYPPLWWAPPRRAILELDKLHISRSLQRAARKAPFKFTRNSAFEQVVQGCATTHKRAKKSTWITAPLRKGFEELFRIGNAYSLEAWSGDELVGGIFGVEIGAFRSAESMYYHTPNASKLALVELCRELCGTGISWIDLQVLNPFTVSLGATEIDRERYMKLLEQALLL